MSAVDFGDDDPDKYAPTGEVVYLYPGALVLRMHEVSLEFIEKLKDAAKNNPVWMRQSARLAIMDIERKASEALASIDRAQLEVKP